MPRGLSARVDVTRASSAFAEWYRFAEQRMESAALIATDRRRIAALARLRGEMQAAGLGRLGNAISSTSDLAEGRGVHRYPGGGFSASGTLFIRSGSERTRGAIEAYTRGAEIRPVRGRWLWIPSEDVQRLVGSGRRRQRITPGLWREYGLESKIGPLVMVRSVNGYPLLVVKNVGVSAAGAPRSARSLTKRGAPRKGQVAREMVVMFIGIPRTARAARVDADALMRAESAQLRDDFFNALGRI